jgi:hypothetical protein
MESWIATMCRKAARQQVVLWLVVLAVGVAIVAMNWRYVRNFFAGPYAMDGAALSAVSNAATTPRYFVAVQPTDVLDTGIQETTTTTENGQATGSYVSAGFYGVKVGDRFLIVKSASKPTGRITGALDTVPTELTSDLFTGADGQDLQQHCYPFYMDASSDFRENGYIGCVVAALLALLLWFFGRRSLARMLNPESHPLVKRVSQWGDLQLISHQVESELNDVRLSAGSVRVTDNFAVEKSLLSFDLYRLHDLLWGYEKIVRRRVYFVIPAGKSYAAVLKFYGGNLQVSASEAKVRELLKYVAGRAPWAVFGYTEQLNTLFSKQTAEFTRAVEARREETAAKA